MNAIVAVDEKWGIGKNNGLLFHLPKDLKYFKGRTEGKIVVMGSNTLLSFPKSKPLPNRTNIVLWPGGEARQDCVIVQSLTELATELKKYPTEDIFIVGGAMFYRTMLDYCTRVYVTKVGADGGAAVFFENLDKRDGWSMEEVFGTEQDGEITLTYTAYRNAMAKEFVG